MFKLTKDVEGAVPLELEVTSPDDEEEGFDGNVAKGRGQHNKKRINCTRVLLALAIVALVIGTSADYLTQDKEADHGGDSFGWVRRLVEPTELKLAPSADWPYAACTGDCGGDHDGCRGDLKCWPTSSGSVPGCAGSMDRNAVGYCYDPSAATRHREPPTPPPTPTPPTPTIVCIKNPCPGAAPPPAPQGDTEASPNEPVTPPPSVTTPPPTPCSGDTIKVEIETDDYPGETTWTLTDECDGSLVAKGGPYGDADTLYVESYCLPSSEYTFEIKDSGNDGICCSQGNGSYEYDVNHNGLDYVLHGGGGIFEASEKTTFGACPAFLRI